MMTLMFCGGKNTEFLLVPVSVRLYDRHILLVDSTFKGNFPYPTGFPQRAPEERTSSSTSVILKNFPFSS